MNKKIWIPLIILALIFTLGACGGNTKVYNYDLSKYITVGEYTGLEVSFGKVEVTQADKDLAIGGILAAAAKKKIEKVTTGVANNGDNVNIDFSGTLDGVPFEGGSAKAQDLKLGSGSMIAGFEEQIVGKSIGSTFTIQVTFPKDYHKEDLRSAAAEFEITINYKEGELVMPEFNEEFVKNNSQFATVKEYMDELEKTIYEQKEGQEKAKVKNTIWQKIMESSEVIKYPDKDLTRIKNQLHIRYQPIADYHKIEFAEVIATIYEMSEEELLKIICREEMVIYTIARNEKINISKEDYDEELLAMFENEVSTSISMEEFDKLYKQTYEKNVGKDTVTANALKKKVLDWLLEANIAS